MVGGFGGSLIVNTLVVYPVTKAILTNVKRFPKESTRKLLAVLFLAFMGVLSVAMDLVQVLEEPNYFRSMGLSRLATDKDVRMAYQQLAKELHPDRNQDNFQAQERFIEMKAAYDILANPAQRQVYDRWGMSGLRWLADGDNVLTQGLMTIGITYVIWFALTILLTVQSGNTHSRSISLAGLALIVAVDVHMKTEGINFYVPFMSHLTVHQLSQLLITIYPTYIGGTVVFQNFTYVDPVARNFSLLVQLYQMQNKLGENLQILEKEMRLTQKAGALPKGIVAGGAGQPATGASSLPRHLQAKNQQAGRPQPKPKTGIPSWAFMVGFYVLFNYVLK